MDGYDASTYGDRFADVYDHWYGTVTDVAACTERLAGLVREVGGGPVLELGIGTGRLALPLAGLGIEVHGIDSSQAMLDRLAGNTGSRSLRVTRGDMATLELVDAPPFAVVFVAYNTFFNLGTRAAQEQCLRRVAEVLSPNGRFVVEAFVPPEPTQRPSRALEPARISIDEVVLTASEHDPIAQTISGQHMTISEAGIRLRPWHLRYAPPAELDAMAGAAGLELDWRHAGWDGAAFGPHADAHVSAYRRTNVEIVRTSGSSSR